MSSTTKYSNYASFQNCNSKLIQMQQFDKSGSTGQVIGSAGENGLVWVPAGSGPIGPTGPTGSTGPTGATGTTLPILTDPAPNGSNFLLADGQNVYDNSILTYNGSHITAKDNYIEVVSTTSPNTATLSKDTLRLVDSTSSGNYNAGVLYFTTPNGGTEVNGSTTSITLQDPTGVYRYTTNNTSMNFTDNVNFSNMSRFSLSFNTPTTQSNLTTNVLYFNKSNVTTAFLNGDSSSLTLTDGTQTSELTHRQLTLTGTTPAILSSTNLTFNSIPYSRNMVNTSLIYSAAIIYADGTAPATNLTIRNTYGYNGWYFKNTPPAGKKINWYFSPQQTNTTTVADIKGLAVSFFNGITTSNDDTLFLTIYTVPTGSGDYAPGFYHSAMTYVFDQTVTPVANTNYQGVAICDPANIPFYYETQVAYEPSTVNNPKGTYLPTDKVLAVVIGSNSASSVNTVEFVVQKLHIIMNGFTKELLFVSP